MTNTPNDAASTVVSGSASQPRFATPHSPPAKVSGADMAPVLSIADLAAFMDSAFPDSDPRRQPQITYVGPGIVRMVLTPQAHNLRPGQLVSGPTQMGLADHAAYAVILAHIGPVAMAVTSNLNMSFLRGVAFEPVIAEAVLLKLGRRLATVDVRLSQDSQTGLVAQATVTYAIPAS
jgi:uncharacterized protein (TIGR00369 family)